MVLVNGHSHHDRMDVVGAAAADGEFAAVVDQSERDRKNSVIDDMAVPVGDVLIGALSGGHRYSIPQHTNYCCQHELRSDARLDDDDDGAAVVGVMVCYVDPCLNRNAWADDQMQKHPCRRSGVNRSVLHCYDHGHLDGGAVGSAHYTLY